MTVSDDYLLYVGSIEEIEAEKAQKGVSPWGPNPEALTELAYADWRGKAAPRFPEGSAGACFHHPNPDLWFSDLAAERAEAQRLCMSCLIRSSCDTQSEGERHGTWAGHARDGRRTSDTCPNGHNEWSQRRDGRRDCRACMRQRTARLRESRRKAA